MKRLLLLLAFLANAAVAQPILTKTILESYDDLAAFKSSGNEAVWIAAGKSNAPLVRPLQYMFQAGAGPVNPPFVVAEALGKGRWYCESIYNGELDPGLFGVIANGSVDDTIPWQAAIDYAMSNNVPTLLVPPRVSKISSLTKTGVLNIGSIAFKGYEGIRSTFSASSSATMFSFTSLRNLRFDNIWFDANNISTNIMTFNDVTQCVINDNVFYSSLGTGIKLTGPQCYGFDIGRNNMVNMTTAAIIFDGVSTAANVVHDNTIQTSGGAYTNTARAIWVRQGSVNLEIRHNIMQRLYRGVDLDGNGSGTQISSAIHLNYFEACYNAPIKFGGSLHSMVTVNNNYFNQQFTLSGFAVQDTAGSIVYGFNYHDNAITPDAGKAISMTNSLVRSWKIKPAAADIATDYELPSNVPLVMESQSQRLESLTVTNFTVTLGSSQLAIPGDLLPNRIEFSANSNASVTVNGFIYDRTRFSIYNAGTNNVTFSPLGVDVRTGTEETFQYRNFGWRRERLSYLPDAGGTVYGSVNVTNAFTAGGQSTFNGNVDFFGTAGNPAGYLSYGGYGSPSTNIFVVGAKPGAVIGFSKDGTYYMFIGTNGVVVVKTQIDLAALTNNIGWFAGWTTDPSTGGARLYSMTLADVKNALNIVTAVGAGNGISVTSGTNVSAKLLAGPGITLSTNGGTGEITINNIGTNSAGATNGTTFYVDSILSTVLNFLNSAELDPAVSGTNLTVTIIANSIETNKVTSNFRSFFLARANHTGTQVASTISDFSDATWAQITNSLVASNNITFAYDGALKKLMIATTAGSATNVPIIAVDGTPSSTTNINFADSAELLVTKSGSNVTYALAATAVTNGTYSNPTITVDSKGRITAISSGAGGTNVTGIWQTIAGVKFMTTNDSSFPGTAIVLDASRTAYSGIGTNLTTQGTSTMAANEAQYFNLEFSPPLTHTNYLVYLDYEGARNPGSSGIFVGDGTDFVGRRTNGVTFAIVSTAGIASYTASDHPIRVWVVDPNATINAGGGGGSGGISGIQINGSGASSNAVSSATIIFDQSGGDFSAHPTNLPATLLTSGTVDIARLPTNLLTEAEAAAIFATITNAALKGTTTVERLDATLMVISNLVVTGRLQLPRMAYGVGWSTTNQSNATPAGDVYAEMELRAPKANPVFSGTVTTAGETNTGNLGVAGNMIVGSTNIAAKLAELQSLLTFPIDLGSELAPGAAATNSTMWVPGRKGINWASGTANDRAYFTAPMNCTLVKVVWDLRNTASASPTGSNIVWSFRLNNTTDTPIHTNLIFDGGFMSTNSGPLSIDMNAGDTGAIKYAMPVWLSTAPQTAGSVRLYFRPR